VRSTARLAVEHWCLRTPAKVRERFGALGFRDADALAS
jgi:hypothetical protein